MKKQVYTSILGGYDLGTFIGFVFWALVGAFILVNIHAQTRDPLSSRTDIKFKWSTWLRDNIRRTAFNLTLILVVVRFSQDLTGRAISDFWAFVIGFSSDGLALLLNKFRIVNLIGTFNKKA
jgi:hypothetical protein